MSLQRLTFFLLGLFFLMGLIPHREDRSGSSSSEPPAWLLYQGTPVEGLTTPNDTDDLAAAAGTVYDPDTGLFQFTTTASALVRDGRNENLAHWSFPVISVYPDYDPATDLLEMHWQVVAFTDTGAGWGIGLGLADDDAAGHATWGSQRIMVYDSAGAGSATLIFTNGGAASGTLIVSTPTAWTAEFRTYPDFAGGGIVAYSSVLVPAGWRSGSGDDLEGFDNGVTEDIHFTISLVHGLATVSAGEVFSGYLWTRRSVLTLDHP